MLLCQNAVMYLEAYANVKIANNSAENTGGGLCVETSDYIESQEVCFFQLGYEIFVNLSLIESINFTGLDSPSICLVSLFHPMSTKGIKLQTIFVGEPPQTIF